MARPLQAPNGEFASASGFDTKREALDYGTSMETDVRRLAYFDPKRAQTPLADWVATWMASTVCSDRTRENRTYLLTLLLPRWGALRSARSTGSASTTGRTDTTCPPARSTTR